MKTKTIRMTLVFIIMISGYISASAQTNDELRAKIIKINKELAQAMIDGNYQKSLGYYTNDAISMPNQEKMLEGIDAIKKSGEAMASSGMKVKSFVLNTLYTNTCDNMVVEIGTFKMSVTMAGMQNPMDEVGKYVTIWEKQPDGSLKIKLETWNSDTNPMGNQ